jgi:hypothetical protein
MCYLLSGQPVCRVGNKAASQHSLSLSSRLGKCVYWLGEVNAAVCICVAAVWAYNARSSLQDGFAKHVHKMSAFICVRTGTHQV